MPSLTITVSQDWVARFDAMIRSDRPWEDGGTDPRKTSELFLDWVRDYARRDIRRHEGNVAAEAVTNVSDPE